MYSVTFHHMHIGRAVTLHFSPTVQVLGVPGVRAAGCMDQYGLDLRHPHPVPLYPALQHLLSENPLALLHRWSLHPCYIQVWALRVMAGKRLALTRSYITKVCEYYSSYFHLILYCPCLYPTQAGFVEGDFELRHILYYGGCGFTIMRCMSFALENCEKKDGNYNILELLKYNFYLPFFYFGPIMTFDKFHAQVSFYSQS